jgi:hypothetical protein
MIFKKGDKVFDYAYGWGYVYDISDEEWGVYVTFEGEQVRYNKFGRVNGCSFDNTLSFTEYTLEGFSQVRPKEPLPFKVGDVVYVSDTALSRWVTCQLTSINSDNGDNPFCTGSDWKYIALENPLLNPDTIIYTKDDL